jgi:uncharacterized BrkB/YihY/UPF0761 family membrane protein
MQAYALFILGLVLGVAGLCYLFFRAKKTVSHEVMLGTAMTIIGWTLAAVGGILVLFS